LVEAFCGAREGADRQGPATRLRLRSDVLAGTWEALVSGQVDLALGIAGHYANPGNIEIKPLGELAFVFCVAPQHPLARVAQPIGADQLVHHRAIAVADTAQRMTPLTVNLLPGQDVLTVPHTRGKLLAILRGLGCGNLPEPLARPHLEAGRLVQRETATARRSVELFYGWRADRGPAGLGKALRWWLTQLESDTTRRALLERHAGSTE
jgi:DNA-binding transcriptional LysR family regulator